MRDDECELAASRERRRDGRGAQLHEVEVAEEATWTRAWGCSCPWRPHVALLLHAVQRTARPKQRGPLQERRSCGGRDTCSGRATQSTCEKQTPYLLYTQYTECPQEGARVGREP